MNILKTCSIVSSIIFLTSCGSSGRVVEKKSNGEYQADHGPFDSKGNYIEGWADNPPRRTYKKSSSRSRSSRSSSTQRSTTRTTKRSTPSRSSSKPTAKRTTTKTKKKTTSKTRSKTRSKPKKITPKTKPPVMHTVRKGDTVYGLARKYGASPNAIIKANSIKKGMIRVGQRLVIPRK